MFTLGEFGLYFTAALESFSKAEQEFLDHSSHHILLSRPGEECSLKLKCLTLGLKQPWGFAKLIFLMGASWGFLFGELLCFAV